MRETYVTEIRILILSKLQSTFSRWMDTEIRITRLPRIATIGSGLDPLISIFESFIPLS